MARATTTHVFALDLPIVTVEDLILLKGEWWRKGHCQSAILALGSVEPVTDSIAKAAGEALANVAGATAIDATVI